MNRNELRKLLQDLGQELKTSIEEAKKDLAQARGISTQINNYFKNVQEIFNDLTNEETGVAKRLKSVETLETSIETAKTNADAHLTSITTALASVQTKITEMETAYQSFTEINDKITDDESGLKAILAESKSLYSDIEATKVTTETVFKEIGKFKDTASNYINEIAGLKTTATKTLEKIAKNHEESENLKSRIDDIFKVSSRDVHANYFDERKRTLGKTSIAWLIAFLIMLAVTITLGIVFIAPLSEIIKNGDTKSAATVSLEAFLVRLGIVTPALLATIYCLNQFGHDRRLHEKYAFKAVSMLSIESSVQLLDRSLEKNKKEEERDNKIINFAVTTLESIYSDPVDGTSRSWIFRGGNKVLQLSTEINESVGEIKRDVDKISDKVVGQ